MGLRQEIVRVNNGTDNHTLLTQTDWKLKHQPQRKICKEIRECSGALYSQALLALEQRQMENLQNIFVSLKKILID